MTTFYRGPVVLITDKVFLVRVPTPMRFRMESLHGAYIVTWRQPSLWSRSRGARELRAYYGRREVVLFRSTDSTVFGQVQRGLLRALEAQQRRREQVA